MREATTLAPSWNVRPSVWKGTLSGNGRLGTVAASNDVVLEMDHDQYDTGEGPCLDSTPLVAADLPIGALNVYSRTVGAFAEHEKQWADQFAAAEAVVVMANAEVTKDRDQRTRGA